MRTDNSIHRITGSILRNAGLTVPPIDVEIVAEFVGATIKREQFDGELSGALYRFDEGSVIGVNSEHHENRQRFTIAHEVGHLVLHEDPVFVDRSYAAPPVRNRPSYLRDAKSSHAVDPKEIEANKFAAALLMPADMIREALERLDVPVDHEGLEDLASAFGVSTQAMGFRLVNLGVPVQQT